MYTIKFVCFLIKSFNWIFAQYALDFSLLFLVDAKNICSTLMCCIMLDDRIKNNSNNGFLGEIYGLRLPISVIEVSYKKSIGMI